MLLASLWLLDFPILPRHACCCRHLAFANVCYLCVVLLLLPTLLLPGFLCCWRPWSPAAVFLFAVDCFASIACTFTDDPFLLVFLLIMTFLLLLS